MIRSMLRGLTAAAALLVLASTSAHAQAAESRFGVKAGLALPMGDFGDFAGLGFHLGGHMGIPLQGALSLRIDADYGMYGGDDDAGTDNTSLFGGMANLVYRMTTQSELKPYFLGGLGFYNVKVEGIGGGSTSDSELAFNFGVGYDFKLANSNLFTELRFVSVQTEGSSLNTLPIVIGLRF